MNEIWQSLVARTVLEVGPERHRQKLSILVEIRGTVCYYIDIDQVSQSDGKLPNDMVQGARMVATQIHATRFTKARAFTEYQPGF